jgi:hypothetical protein
MSLSDRQVRKSYNGILRRVFTSLILPLPVSIPGPALRAIAPSTNIVVVLPQVSNLILFYRHSNGFC